MHAKFDVFSANRSRDMEGSQNFKSRSRDPFPTPFDLIFVSTLGDESACQIRRYYLQLPEIWRGSKISKVGHVTPSRPVNRGSPVTRYLDSSTPI